MKSVRLASAGTGKTYTVVGQLRQWLAAGIPAESIVATTFTKKAAAELEERVLDRILYPEPDDENHGTGAERHHLAAESAKMQIGTVHKLALHWLDQYGALRGWERKPVLIENDGAKRLLAEVLNEQPWALRSELQDLLERCGQADLLTVARKLIQLAASQGIAPAGLASDLRQSADAAIADWDSVPQVQLPGKFDDLREALAPHAVQEVGTEAQVLSQKRAALELLMVRPNHWAQWRSLKADALANVAPDLPKWANAMFQVPEFRKDWHRMFELLAQILEPTMEQLLERKKQLGVVEYGDLEFEALQLWNHPDCPLRDQVQCLIVDEFQDTNPVQLALFEAIASTATSLFVGDLKQSIYAFRGADVPLLQDTLTRWEGEGAQVDALGVCYRSSQAVVGLANQFVKAQSLDMHFVEPRKQASEGQAACWHVDKFTELAPRVANLRATTPEDESIAVLVKTNNQVTNLLAGLWKLGVAASGGALGLAQSWEIRMLLAALRVVADQPALSEQGRAVGDWEALAELQALRKGQEGTEGLEDALDQLLQHKLPELELFALDRDQGIQSLLEQIIVALDIPAIASMRFGGIARLHNLDTFRATVDKFVTERRSDGLAPSLAGFLAWFEDYAGRKDDRIEAVPAPVQVMTLHQSKGLEWHHTIVVDMEHDPKETSVSLGEWFGPREVSKSHPIGRGIRFNWFPFGGSKDSWAPKALLGSLNELPEWQQRLQESREEAKRLLYVGLTRAKLSVTYAMGDDKKRASIHFAPNGPWPDFQQWQEAHAVAAPAEPADLQVPVLSARKAGPPASPMLLRPSDLPPQACQARQEFVGTGVTTHLAQAGKEAWAALGTAVHAAFASAQSMEAHAKLWGIEAQVNVTELAQMRSEFLAYLHAQGATELLHELPLRQPLAGRVLVGAADLVVAFDSEYWVIDHKSTTAESELQEHAGQLAGYQAALSQATGKPVRAFVHQWRTGTLWELEGLRFEPPMAQGLDASLQVPPQ